MTIADRAAQMLRLVDPERAHALAIRIAGRSRFRPPPEAAHPRLNVEALGLRFANPIGLAAGFDKNGAVPDAMLGLGFGFAEVGTVTPLPQEGNARPRLFRLAADRALVNRLGFNNDGHYAMAERLEARAPAGIVGVNIGANRDSADRLYDYQAGVRLFAPLASYLAINISSPNTPGLRELQGREALAALLVRIDAARAAAQAESGRRTPLLLKISPDMGDPALAELIETAMTGGVDGLIVANTTISRPKLESRSGAAQIGGLSGAPLFELSTAMLARARQLAGPDLVLVGVGGVGDAGAAWSKIAAGADLVQLYTGLVYEGPSLPRRIVAGLLKRLEERNIAHIRDVRGIEMTRWAAGWAR